MPNMGLILHCKLKYRVWPHAHISRLRLKIFFTPKYLPKRPHGTKFQQNHRNSGSQRLHEIENLSVNEKMKKFSTRLILHHKIFAILVQRLFSSDFQNSVFLTSLWLRSICPVYLIVHTCGHKTFKEIFVIKHIASKI